MIDYNDALTQTSNGNRIKNDNILTVKDKNINIGYTKGGSDPAPSFTLKMLQS